MNPPAPGPGGRHPPRAQDRREVALVAVLDIIDRDGAGALSMRHVAHALDRDPMILYRHATNKGDQRYRGDDVGGTTGAVDDGLRVRAAGPHDLGLVAFGGCLVLTSAGS